MRFAFNFGGKKSAEKRRENLSALAALPLAARKERIFAVNHWKSETRWVSWNLFLKSKVFVLNANRVRSCCVFFFKKVHIFFANAKVHWAKKLLTQEKAKGQIKSTGTWWDLISTCKGLKKLNLYVLVLYVMVNFGKYITVNPNRTVSLSKLRITVGRLLTRDFLWVQRETALVFLFLFIRPKQGDNSLPVQSLKLSSCRFPGNSFNEREKW